MISEWCEEGVLHGDTIGKSILSGRNNGGSGMGKHRGNIFGVHIDWHVGHSIKRTVKK